MFKFKHRGFTLIELTIVIVMMGIVGYGAVEMLRLGAQSQMRSQQALTAAWDGQVAVTRITEDLHTIKSPSNITTAASNALTFTNYNGATISYSVSGNQLFRNSQPLANSVTSLTFSYYDASGNITATIANIRYIGVNLTINNGVTYDFTTGVFIWGVL